MSLIPEGLMTCVLSDAELEVFKNNLPSPLQLKGISLGYEVENKKAKTSHIQNHMKKSSKDEELSRTSTFSPKSTSNSDHSYERPITADDKSVLGKRKCPLIEGCNEIENYTLLNYIHEGVYGIVYRARDKYSKEIRAVKKVKLFDDDKEGFPISCLREINLLNSLSHPNIVNMREVVMGKSMDEIFLVMDFAEHELRDLIQNYKYDFTIPELKSLMKQLFQAISYLHSKDIIHRDLKTSNLLYTKEGLLKVCDFGLSRRTENSKKAMTPTVVTLTYRAPELLLGSKAYNKAIDVWSIGCIFAELLLKNPVFKGKNEMDHLHQIFKTLGLPSKMTWSGWTDLRFARFFENLNYQVNKLHEIFLESSKDSKKLSESGLDLLEKLLTYDPAKRISAEEALKHAWFKEIPNAVELKDMPKFNATNEIPRELAKKIHAKILEKK